jgi:uncharacterized protein YrrD
MRMNQNSGKIEIDFKKLKVSGSIQAYIVQKYMIKDILHQTQLISKNKTILFPKTFIFSLFSLISICQSFKSLTLENFPNHQLKLVEYYFRM